MNLDVFIFSGEEIKHLPLVIIDGGRKLRLAEWPVTFMAKTKGLSSIPRLHTRFLLLAKIFILNYVYVDDGSFVEIIFTLYVIYNYERQKKNILL